ncbi:MAG: formylglycine-generating enzyme family protein, partial [Candidatus Heimdallarchaeota archaeon]|nr:formylglycine-generating enzyme family protein [Candidatus Heimdallarchaeota archaeon]
VTSWSAYTSRTPEFSNSLGMKFVFIKSGTFMMGSPPYALGSENDETQHQVNLTRGFYLQTTEVTQGQWKSVMGSNFSMFSNCGDDCPVENVSWDEVQEFIRKLSSNDKSKKYRLPTEAEWEYACCGGTTDELYGNLDNIAWYIKNSKNQTQRVGQKKANDFGLYDMLGNVGEWCNDWYDKEYPKNPQKDPKGPKDRFERLLRGGSWSSFANNIRSAYRQRKDPYTRENNVGIRLVRSLNQQVDEEL